MGHGHCVGSGQRAVCGVVGGDHGRKAAERVCCVENGFQAHGVEGTRSKTAEYGGAGGKGVGWE